MAGQIITIGRQCGSGGHTIGEQVAKILGVPFYDRELIEMTAQESGFGKEFVEEQGEHRNSSMLYNLVKNLSYSRTMPSGNSEYLQDEIFFAQRKSITELAGKEPCVIVGRCADSILKETGNSLNIYIHAGKAFKARHLMERNHVSYDEAVREMEQLDKRRASHYKYYTDQVWGLAENYHLCLDSSLIGIEKCVSVICDIYQSINAGNRG